MAPLPNHAVPKPGAGPFWGLHSHHPSAVLSIGAALTHLAHPTRKILARRADELEFLV